jgi:putative DNA primase/helicase
MLDFSLIKVASTGRWQDILGHLGIDVGNGEHRACPVCGGTDRFRFDDRDGRGTWFCNACGAGDGVKLVEKFLGIDFASAMSRIAEAIGQDLDQPPRRQQQRRRDPVQARKNLNRLWLGSRPLTGSDPASKYLRGRGLMMALSDDVRFCPACWEAETKTEMPAMVARVRNPAGKPVSIHRTYLNGTRKAAIKAPKKLMPAAESLTGCAIRLFVVEDHVGVAEGIETAIAACQLFGVPTWACISTTVLEKFTPPEGVRHVTIFSDNDANFAGQAAAYQLAKKLFAKDYLVDVKIPPPGDWADKLSINQ